MVPPRANSSERGAALLDTLVALTLLVLTAASVVPQVAPWSADLHASHQARRVWQWMVAAQTDAIRRGQAVGLEWSEREGRLWGLVFVDGNGNGITQTDLDAGIDVSAGADVPMFEQASAVRFGITAKIRAIDDTGWLEPGSDPIRFGRTDRVTFTPDRRATPGTVYLSGEGGAHFAVRVSGSTGRVQLLRYRRVPGDWVP